MKVAILIPTMNRGDFIERTVAYYNSLNSPHPIYIGDASTPDAAARTTNNLKQFKNVNVKYFNWEGLGAGPTHVRLAEIARSDCLYCALHGDDDYFVPSSLTRCADFLAANKSYKTVQGRAAIFALDRSGPYGEIRVLGQYWGENGLEQETGLDRLEYFRRNYFVSQFSTHRIDEFLVDSNVYKTLGEALGFQEFFHCCLFAINGKSKFLDCLYLIRNVHDGRPSSGLADWIVRPHWSSDFKQCFDSLSLALHESDGMSLGHARKIIVKVMAEYFEKFSLGIDPAPRNANFMFYLRGVLPRNLKNALRPLQRLLMGEKDMRLLRSKRSLFDKDWLPVQRSLKRPSSSKH